MNWGTFAFSLLTLVCSCSNAWRTKTSPPASIWHSLCLTAGRWNLLRYTALLWAGLVTDVAAAAWGVYQLAETIAYLTIDGVPETPWARLENLRLDAVQSQAAARLPAPTEHRPCDGQKALLIAGLKLKGDASCTLVLTRLRCAPVVLVCDDAYGKMAPRSSEE